MAAGQTRWSFFWPVWATLWGSEMSGGSLTSATEMAAVRICNVTNTLNFNT